MCNLHPLSSCLYTAGGSTVSPSLEFELSLSEIMPGMPLAVGVGIWVRCLAERLSGVAAEGIKCGGLAESWEVDEEEVPNCNAGEGGGIDECLRDLLRDLCMGGTTLAARHGRRRPRGNRDLKRGTLIG
jgi:hypothetical protein